MLDGLARVVWGLFACLIVVLGAIYLVYLGFGLGKRTKARQGCRVRAAEPRLRVRNRCTQNIQPYKY